MIQGFLEAAAGQHCMATVLGLVARWLPGAPAVPCGNTGRMWLLRVGLYALTSQKAVAEDWVYIFDHTVQLGKTKVLIIVGIRLSQWESQGRGPLRHKDIAVLDVVPMEHSSGDIVHARLNVVAQQTGTPREIVSDGGTDLAKAIAQFQKEHPGVARGYDIKHKTALLLQRQLDKDPRWANFVRNVTQARARLALTGLACFCPPSLKPKARYMNLEPLIRWGCRTLAFIDHPHDLPGQTVDVVVLREKLGWLGQYREALYHWSVLLQIAATAESYVRAEGYHAGIASQLGERLSGLAINEAAYAMGLAVIQFVTEQSAQARPGEKLIGSSEVLESLIGRYKRVQGTHSQGGVTPLILSVGAMVLDLSAETIRRALSAIRTHDVIQWCRDHLGFTLQSQRRYLHLEQKPETKPLSQPESF